MSKYYTPNYNSMDKEDDTRTPYYRPQIRLARAFILPQPFIGMLPLEKALEVGTVFPNLYNEFPSLFHGEKGKMKREGEI